MAEQPNDDETEDEIADPDTRSDRRLALFVRVGGQDLGTADDQLRKKLEGAGFEVVNINGRTSDKRLLRLLEEADLLFITGHHHIEAGGDPFDFRSDNPANSSINLNFSDLAKKKKAPLSTQMQAVIVTGCNTLKRRGIRFLTKEFPNATAVGWSRPSPKKHQWILWGAMSEHFEFGKDYKLADLGFAVRAAFASAVNDVRAEELKKTPRPKGMKPDTLMKWEKARRLMNAWPAFFEPWDAIENAGHRTQYHTERKTRDMELRTRSFRY